MTFVFLESMAKGSWEESDADADCAGQVALKVHVGVAGRAMCPRSPLTGQPVYTSVLLTKRARHPAAKRAACSIGGHVFFFLRVNFLAWVFVSILDPFGLAFGREHPCFPKHQDMVPDFEKPAGFSDRFLRRLGPKGQNPIWAARLFSRVLFSLGIGLKGNQRNLLWGQIKIKQCACTKKL